MKVGIIGSGGREHALCVSLKKSNKINKIYCFPGNAGTAEIADNIDINIDNFKILTEFIKENQIDIVVVGPEKPLVNGVVDYLENHNIKVFGPNKISSQLEGSKIFTKNLCKKYNIPTANFGVFKNQDKSLLFLKNCLTISSASSALSFFTKRFESCLRAEKSENLLMNVFSKNIASESLSKNSLRRISSNKSFLSSLLKLSAL